MLGSPGMGGGGLGVLALFAPVGSTQSETIGKKKWREEARPD